MDCFLNSTDYHSFLGTKASYIVDNHGIKYQSMRFRRAVNWEIMTDCMQKWHRMAKHFYDNSCQNGNSSSNNVNGLQYNVTSECIIL